MIEFLLGMAVGVAVAAVFCSVAVIFCGGIEYQNEDHCACCGAVVPEGRQVCPNCERRCD